MIYWLLLHVLWKHPIATFGRDLLARMDLIRFVSDTIRIESMKCHLCGSKICGAHSKVSISHAILSQLHVQTAHAPSCYELQLRAAVLLHRGFNRWGVAGHIRRGSVARPPTSAMRGTTFKEDRGAAPQEGEQANTTATAHDLGRLADCTLSVSCLCLCAG